MQRPDDIVRLTTAASEFEAQLMVNKLEDAGIKASSETQAGNVLQWEVMATQPFRVFVRREDVERAREVLVSEKVVSASIDWDSIDVGASEDSPDGESGGLRVLGVAVVIIVLAIVAVFLATR